VTHVCRHVLDFSKTQNKFISAETPKKVYETSMRSTSICRALPEKGRVECYRMRIAEKWSKETSRTSLLTSKKSKIWKGYSHRLCVIRTNNQFAQHNLSLAGMWSKKIILDLHFQSRWLTNPPVVGVFADFFIPCSNEFTSNVMVYYSSLVFFNQLVIAEQPVNSSRTLFLDPISAPVHIMSPYVAGLSSASKHVTHHHTDVLEVFWVSWN